MNQNGQMVLKTLDKMEQPALVTEIIRNVAEAVNARPADIKKTVVDTLAAGVRYGYLQHANNKYSTIPKNNRYDDDVSSSSDSGASSDSSDSSSDENEKHCRKGGGKKRRSRRTHNHTRRIRSRSRSRSRDNSRRRH